MDRLLLLYQELYTIALLLLWFSDEQESAVEVVHFNKLKL
jgi:hypothetical protein